MIKDRIFILPAILLFGFMFTSCEKEEDEEIETFELVNTLDNSSVGNGMTGHIQDYFFSLEDEIEVQFYLFSSASFGFNYEDYLALFNKEPTQLTFKTYPQLVITDTPDDLDTSAYTKITPDSPSWLAERTSLDSSDCPESLCNSGLEISFNEEGKVVEDSVALFSIQFKNVDKLEWEFDAEPDLQRYKPVNSDWLFQSDTIKFLDTLDIVSYTSVIDEHPDEGFVFVDLSEWEKTENHYSSEQNPIFKEFYFPSWRRISGDSLIFRLNTDCNDNGLYDIEAEPEVASAGECSADESFILTDESTGIGFCDRGNGVWDPAEVYVDKNDNGTYDLVEPFEDRNCNELWDDAEEIINDDGNGICCDDSEEFVDRGNGQFNIAEEFTDYDENGFIDSAELYVFNLAPKTLLVSWEDPLNPVPMTTIYPNDSLTTRWGIKYYDIIRETDRSDSKTVWVDNVDSLVTQYNNKIIETVGEEGSGTDYYITKTEWIESDPSFGDLRYYDYHIFKVAENIYKLVHPSYFKPYGYHGFTYDRISQSVSFSTQGYDDGFWYTPNAMDEVLYYTSSGLFRDGEIVNEEYYDTTSVGIYFVSKSQQVFSDSVTVPAKNMRGSINSDGTVQCYTEPPGSVTSIDECPAADTTFNDCFKIIRSVNMTMIGSGVEWEEENTTWLVKNYGVVKTELKVRWGESIWFDSDDEIWAGYSRWEMGQYSSEPGDIGLLSKMLNPVRSVSLHSLDDVDELNNDPYQIHRTLGLHRIQFSLDN